MTDPKRPSGLFASGRFWVRESVLKPAYRWLSTIDHPRQIGQGLDILEKAYRRMDPRPPRVEADAPFVLVVAWGATAGLLARLADELAQACLAQPGWEPLIVTDCAELNAIAPHGFKVEHVPPCSDWCAVNEPDDWPDFLAGRLAHLRQVYAPIGAVVVTGADDLSALNQGVLQVFSPPKSFDAGG